MKHVLIILTELFSDLNGFESKKRLKSFNPNVLKIFVIFELQYNKTKQSTITN